MEPWERAVALVESRARRDRDAAVERLTQVLDANQVAIVLERAPRLRDVGRLTLNFHPDRVASSGLSVAAGLAAQGRYQSQWVTWISSGGRSARPGGARHRWERELFDSAYEGHDPTVTPFPLYGALDLLHDPHGGSPRFGSCFLVLRPHVLDRTTLCIGDSHLGPADVGARDTVLPVMAGLAEQAGGGELLGRRLGVAELLRLLDGDRVVDGPGRELDWYVEAQVHGGVDLSTDVEEIVADPSFRATQVGTDLATAASRHGVDLWWHTGSVLPVGQTPDDFRGPDMPALAKEVAGTSEVIDAHKIGVAAATTAPTPPLLHGDPQESAAQQLKYLWHTLLAHGTDAEPH